MDSAYGKFPDSDEDIEEVEEIYSVQSSIILEISHFFETMLPYLPLGHFHKGFKEFLATNNPYDYVDYIALNIP